MNNRFGSISAQSSGLKRKFPGEPPTDPRFHSGPSRPPVHPGNNFLAGPPFAGRGGPPQFLHGRGFATAGRQGPHPGRGRGLAPNQNIRGGRGMMMQQTYRGGGPRSGGRGLTMRGGSSSIGRGGPRQMQRGPFSSPPPPPPIVQRHPASHLGPRGRQGGGPFIPPPPPPPPPMHHMRHMTPSSQQHNYHQQNLSAPYASHIQNITSPHTFPSGPSVTVPPPTFVPQPIPQQSSALALPPMNQKQRSWNPFPPQQSSGSRPTQNLEMGGIGQNHVPHPSQGHAAVTTFQNQLTPAISSQPSAPAPAAYTKEQIDQAWTEHKAPSGLSYYYNSLLDTSTYQRPLALETKSPMPPTSTEGQQNQQESTQRIWVEYTDPTTGKNYYSDGQTTTWNKPEGFMSAAVPDQPNKTSQSAEPLHVQTENATASENAQLSKSNKRTGGNKKESPFLNKAEAIAAFKGLLLAKGIAPHLKWHEVVKLCSSDSRWDDCEDALTLGERKQSLAEYQTKRANELRTMDRQERIRAKEAFQQLLSALLPSLPNFRASSSRFAEIRDSLSKDDRFYAVQDDDTRESLFLDFCEELRKREDRNRSNKKRECKDAFLEFLREKDEQGVLTFASTWSSFLSSLSEEAAKDSRFAVSPSLSDSDRQVYFADFVIELQTAEDDKRRRIRDARRRAEKAQREAYRDALRSMARDGIINPSTRWRTVEDRISTHSAYSTVFDQDREAPREIFEDFVEEWNEQYRRDRMLLAGLVHPASNRDIVVTANTTFDEFSKALLQEAAFSPELHADTRHIINRNDPVSSARIYFSELVSKAKENSVCFPRARRTSMLHNGSEDEGEIAEEGEVTELDTPQKDKPGGKSYDIKPDPPEAIQENQGKRMQAASTAEEGQVKSNPAT